MFFIPQKRSVISNIALITRMKKILFIAFSFILIYNKVAAQLNTGKPELILSPEVLKLKGGKATDKIIDLVKRYHPVMLKSPYYKGEFWTEASKEKYYLPDYMLKQEFAQYDYGTIVPNMINIFKPDDYYTTQIAYHIYKGKENKGVVCVYTFAMREENDSMKFFPILETYKFKKYQNELITLYCNDTTRNDQRLFDSLNLYNIKLAKMFQTNPVKFSCYKFNDFAEVNQCVGLDVQKNYARTEDNAYCDAYNKMIFGAFYSVFFHEVVHMYVGDQFLKTYHIWMNEGLATYLGGSSGLSLEQHLRYLAPDLRAHTEYNLNYFLDYDGVFISNTSKNVNTNYKFTLGGLICKLVYEKKGFEGLKELLSSGREKNEDLYKAVEKALGVKQNMFDLYLRKEVSKYMK